MPSVRPKAHTGVERQRWALLRNIHCIIEKPMALLALVWLVLMLVELTRGLSRGLELLNWTIWGVFILDFLIEFFVAPRKIAFLRKHWLVVLSLALPALRIFRAVRILRTARAFRSVRLLRVLTNTNRSLRALRSHFAARGFAYVMLITVVVTAAGAAGMFAFENPTSLRASGFPADTGLVSYTDSLWWTAMLMTTFGSAYWPKSGEGRILCLLLSIYAVAVFGYITATLATFLLGEKISRDARSQNR